MRAEPQHGDDAAENEEDGERRQKRARQGGVARRGEGVLDAACEAVGGAALQRIGLHGAHAADRFGREGRSIGEAVLRETRLAAHPAAEEHERQHDHRDGGEDQAGKPRARHHHHRGRAEEEHEVPERDRGAGADGGLDLRGVGGEPRGDVAGARLVEEGGREPHQMGEEVAAEIGDDPLAERHHQVEAGGAGEREQPGEHDQRDEGAVHEAGIAGGEADVDHAPDGERHGERRQRRADKGGDRRRHPPLVAGKIRQHRRQGVEPSVLAALERRQARG